MDINIARTSLLAIKKLNPKLIITVWKTYIANGYSNEIESGNIDFFIDKNYTNDFKDTDGGSNILNKINTLREPIKQMSEENKLKTIQYIQNLTRLCILYHQ